MDFVEEELLELVPAEVVFLTVKVEEVLGERRRARFVLRIMVRLEVRMLERLLDRHALLRIEGEGLGEEVDGGFRGVGVDVGKVALLAEGEGADVVARSSGVDGVELFEGRGSEDVEDESELVVVVAAGEERSAAEHFAEDAADGPDVDGFRVLLEAVIRGQ